MGKIFRFLKKAVAVVKAINDFLSGIFKTKIESKADGTGEGEQVDLKKKD